MHSINHNPKLNNPKVPVKKVVNKFEVYKPSIECNAVDCIRRLAGTHGIYCINANIKVNNDGNAICLHYRNK